MNRIKITDTTNAAFKANRARALEGFDLAAARAAIARKTADFLIAESTRQQTPINFGFMRSLGGFSDVVKRFLPEQVETGVTGHAVPSNPLYFQREAIELSVPDIVNEVKEILNAECPPDDDEIVVRARPEEIERARVAFETLKNNPSPRRFYVRDLNRARRRFEELQAAARPAETTFIFVKAGDVPPDAVKDTKRAFDVIGKTDTVGVFVNFVNADELEVLLECDHVVTIKRPDTPEGIPASFFCKGCQCGVWAKTISRDDFEKFAAHQSPVEV